MALTKKEVDFLTDVIMGVLKKYVDNTVATITNRGKIKLHYFEEEYMRTVNGGLPLDQSLFRTYLQTCGKANLWFDTNKTGILPANPDSDVLYVLWKDGGYAMYIYTDKYEPIGSSSSMVETDPVFTAWETLYHQYLNSALVEAPENPSTKYWNALRQWVEIAVGGGGYQAPLYFTGVDSITAGFKQLNYIPQTASQELPTTARNETKLIRRYVYDQQIGITTIDSGNWVLSGRYKVSSSVGVTRLKIVPFLYHIDGTTTELFTSYSDEINNTEYADITKTFPAGVFHCLETDRLGVDIYIETTSPTTITFTELIGDGHPAYFVSPLRLRHNQLRDPNGDPNVQHLTAAQIADIPLKSMPFENVPVLFENCTNDSPYGVYPYQQIIPLQGVTENDFPDVAFSVSDIESGNYCPIAMTNNGNVIIYSKTNSTTVIPTILIHRL